MQAHLRLAAVIDSFKMGNQKGLSDDNCLITTAYIVTLNLYEVCQIYLASITSLCFVLNYCC